MSEDQLSAYRRKLEKELLSYLYLISEGPHGPIKVGVSANPVARLSCLQTGNSRPLKILASFRFMASEVYEIEKMFQLDFHYAALLGEWFDISEALILECMPDFFKANGYQAAA